MLPIVIGIAHRQYCPSSSILPIVSDAHRLRYCPSSELTNVGIAHHP
jgi:hypothetical protein